MKNEDASPNQPFFFLFFYFILFFFNFFDGLIGLRWTRLLIGCIWKDVVHILVIWSRDNPCYYSPLVKMYITNIKLVEWLSYFLDRFLLGPPFFPNIFSSLKLFPHFVDLFFFVSHSKKKDGQKKWVIWCKRDLIL